MPLKGIPWHAHNSFCKPATSHPGNTANTHTTAITPYNGSFTGHSNSTTAAIAVHLSNATLEAIR